MNLTYFDWNAKNIGTINVEIPQSCHSRMKAWDLSQSVAKKNAGSIIALPPLCCWMELIRESELNHCPLLPLSQWCYDRHVVYIIRFIDWLEMKCYMLASNNQAFLFQRHVGRRTLFWQLLMIRWWMYKYCTMYYDYNVVFDAAHHACAQSGHWRFVCCFLCKHSAFSIRSCMRVSKPNIVHGGGGLFYFSFHCRLKTLAHWILIVTTKDKTRQDGWTPFTWWKSWDGQTVCKS